MGLRDFKSAANGDGAAAGAGAVVGAEDGAGAAATGAGGVGAARSFLRGFAVVIGISLVLRFVAESLPKTL